MDKASVTSQLFMGGMGDTILVNLGKYKIQMYRNTVSITSSMFNHFAIIKP